MFNPLSSLFLLHSPFPQYVKAEKFAPISPSPFLSTFYFSSFPFSFSLFHFLLLFYLRRDRPASFVFLLFFFFSPLHFLLQRTHLLLLPFPCLFSLPFSITLPPPSSHTPPATPDPHVHKSSPSHAHTPTQNARVSNGTARLSFSRQRGAWLPDLQSGLGRVSTFFSFLPSQRQTASVKGESE